MLEFKCGNCVALLEQKRIADYVQTNCQCRCATCNRRGYVVSICPRCNGVDICETCGGSGKRWIGNCKHCRGSGRCGSCSNGKVTISCPACKGLGADSSCAICKGSGCKVCLGTRHVDFTELLSILRPSPNRLTVSSSSSDEMGLEPRHETFPVFTYEQLVKKVSPLRGTYISVREFSHGFHGPEHTLELSASGGNVGNAR